MPSNEHELIKLPAGQPRLIAAKRPRTQHGHVMHELGLGIIGGGFPENSILPGDEELQRRFRVSRTVLREALKTLSAKGLVQAKAKIGTRVLQRQFWNLFDPDILYWYAETGVDVKFLHHLSEVRLALEPEAAALAAERRTEENVEQLYRWIDRMADPQSTAADFVEADLRFHNTVADASGNPMMRSVSGLIEVALAITFTISSPVPNTPRHARTVARHRAIADAISHGDADAARGAMRAVIREGLERVAAEKGEKAAG